MKAKGKDNTYHHGDLAESLLEAVDHIARKFGLEAVTLRACAKLLGVAPSAGFRHYADKRALFTAFAIRAQRRMAQEMRDAGNTASAAGEEPLVAVGLAYLRFALKEPPAFQVMWRSELIYPEDPLYKKEAQVLSGLLRKRFPKTSEPPCEEKLEPEDLLVWAAVHGMASLYTENPLLNQSEMDLKLEQAEESLRVLLSSMSSP